MSRKYLKKLQDNKLKTTDEIIPDLIPECEKTKSLSEIEDAIKDVEIKVKNNWLKRGYKNYKCNSSEDYFIYTGFLGESAERIAVNCLMDRERKSDENDLPLKNYSSLLKRKMELDKHFNELKSGYFEKEISEHESTRLFVSDKIDNLSSEMVKKDDLIKAKDEIIEKIESESKVIQEKLENKIKELKKTLNSYLPHKRVFRISTFFMSVLLFSIFSDLFLGIQIIKPYWATLGLLVSGGFLIMSYFIFLEWKKSINNGESDR